MDEPATSTCPRPVLISIGGLPATDNTTVSRLVASHRRAAYVRVDTLEAAIAASEGVHETTNGWESPPGYLAGRARPGTRSVLANTNRGAAAAS
ncbi:hypothetical protein [Aeromicrobium sp. A1-2]|uniref:hypothetical protein n=1 Tax=Aeromicrobium sp. A1-2 TaxID=2107713 RepID=UPI0013C30092|nr:hypothetical protein [Aeromicrobium sp. A1-2]